LLLRSRLAPLPLPSMLLTFCEHVGKAPAGGAGGQHM
jgi:hypothetical protein